MKLIKTGLVSLDLALGGGLPLGAISELRGPDRSGKTLLSLSVLKSAQDIGKPVVYFDLEKSLNSRYLKMSGLSPDRLIVARPKTVDSFLESCFDFIYSGAAIVVDSLAGLTTEEDSLHDGWLDSNEPVKDLCYKIVGTQSILFLLNQIRSNIGSVVYRNRSASGSSILRSYSAVRLLTSKKTDTIEVLVTKNNFYPPYKHAFFSINDKGINYTLDLLNVLSNKGIIKRSGPWVLYKDKQIGLGLNEAASNLDQNTELKNELLSLNELYD